MPPSARWTGIATLLVLISGQPAAATVSICADPDPPPWSYWVRDAQNKPTKTLAGSSVETVRAAFAHMGMEANFIGDLPWARCLKKVAEGEIDFAMDAYYDDERAKTFAYSTHYSTLTPQIFFRADTPLRITSTADLKRYKGCGLLGASYAHYDLRESDLDLGVNTYDAMVHKLKLGRCDYFVEELEVIAGFKKLGRNYLNDATLLHAKVPGAKAPAKHLITARGGASENLLPKLDRALEKMIKSGEVEQIWKRHTRASPYQP